jgi:hypothetical protein
MPQSMIDLDSPELDYCDQPSAGLNIDSDISDRGLRMVAFSVVAALLVGFLAGLLTFKSKQRWCERCGRTLTCASCLINAETDGRKR